ncbi:hypothetical protein [Hymenobacter terrenus]|uniref:hypothetical protein n=1 Tax=Hymenobacter terrenus TaxID=1629124 RepID=UPI0006199DE9|nr:hypothetical protein [Hymenobacter terrenus]
MSPIQKKPTFTREADFRRERDFGAKIGATFEFVAAQFKPLFQCVAYFVLPAALVGGIGIGLFMSNMLGMIPQMGQRTGSATTISRGYSGTDAFSASSVVGVGLASIGFLVAFLLLSGTVYGFVRVRMSTPPDEVVQPAQVWAFVWSRLGRIVRAWLLLGVVMLVGTGVVAGCLALLGPGFVFLIFFPMMWAIVCLTLYFPILWIEDGGVVAALGRAFYLIKGKWWSTLGLYIIMSFITSTINYVFIIPFYGLMAARVMLKVPGFDSEILSVVTMSIYVLGWVFTAVLPLLAMLFQYFNLVERKEGLGLRLLVDSLGQGPPQVSSTTYQPDEEGEY